jgi:transcriptional regulator with XRE-family HTH domain
VRGAIAQADLTQAEAAAKIGVALNTFSRRINGALPFTWPELVRVADVAGVTVGDLASAAERIASRGTAA